MEQEIAPQDIPRADLRDGYIARHGLTPVLRLSRYCSPDDVRRKESARLEAQSRRHSEFNAKCAVHGQGSLFDTATGACLLCVIERTDLPVQLRYRAGGGSCYADRCEKHGNFVARFGDDGCPVCRAPHRGARQMARQRGSATFEAVCEVHGPIAHNVKTGRCLTCHTATGAIRGQRAPGAPIQPDNLRAAARRSGQSTYLAPCEACGGDQAHSVLRGKCLACFNTLGHPRKKKGPPDKTGRP